MNISDLILGYVIGKNGSGGGGGGGGLEYEEGTWTPSANIAETRISFANNHTKPPFAFAVIDATGSNYAGNDANMFEYFYDNSQFGGPINISASSYEYGRVVCGYKAGGGASIGQWYQQLTAKSQSGTAIYRNDARYWATETSIGLYTGDPSQEWLASRTYKWIAVWMPESE